jgi:peptidyl-prolyl cis-trans isomerase D
VENYERAYGKMQVAVVRLRNEDFEKEVKITDDEIAKYYEAQKAQLKTEEKRRVEFVTFVLTEEEKKLTGKERVDALQRVADRANDFSQALLEKDANFGQIAARFQSPVLATAEFTAAAPDPQLTTSPQATQIAFQLSQQTPFSDPVQGPDGFNILHLLAVTEARPLNLDEAKPKITETLKAERLRELISKKGGEIAGKLREGLKMGTALEKVAEQNGVKLERIPAFAAVEKPTPKPEPAVDPAAPTPPASPTPDPTKDVPDFRTIKSVVGVLNAGEVSDYTPAAKGGLIAVLEKRDPADPAGYAEAKTQFEQRYLVARRSAVFVEWMRNRRRTANVVVATG